ncbi:MAG: ATP synthase F1 subunit epsilon [Candidatus Symbiobacter sp.]|nr:ATP synthase F1 subunit epsilon [Candidatus Symbiobacter sp.]
MATEPSVSSHAASFHLELVTPEKIVFNRRVAAVTLPASEGVMQILPGHAPVILALRPGVVDILDGAAKTPPEKFFVEGGFAEISQDRCVLLLENAVTTSSIDPKSVAERLAALPPDAAPLSTELPATGHWPARLVLQAMIE